MSDFGIYKGENLLLVCGSKEKAEEMLENYPGHYISEVERVNNKWEKVASKE